MSNNKNARYIITQDIRMEMPPNAGFLKRIQDQRAAGDFMDAFHMLSLNDKVAQGALYFDAVWMTGLHGTHGFQVEIQHSHDFDEILGFFGSDRDNYRDLHAEIELWLEDEQYFITQSAVVFVPKGMPHLPLYFRRVDSPVLFFTMGNGTSYTRASGNEMEA
jgi:hypothetical protein